MESKKFLDFVYDFLILFEHWDNYFKTSKVKAIIGSHAVYVMGLILRMAKNINQKAMFLLMINYGKLIKNNHVNFMKLIILEKYLEN